MNTAAVIIGVDAYRTRPLTSCVNDALAFREVLLQLGLVAGSDIDLLTAPITRQSTGTADGDTIRQTLLKFYRSDDDHARLYVYFAGHGLLGKKAGSVQGTRTVLVPSDVVDFANEGHKMIDLDELHDYLRLVGPPEQFYFIDACRNLDYTVSPMVGTLGWSDQPPQWPRAQATLYAVAELSEAGGVPNGNGFMTTHLIDALRGAGAAVDYDPGRDVYQITAESVREYVRRRMEERIRANPQSLEGITVPQLDSPDPRPTALRELPTPPDVELVVHVVPDNLAPATQVTLSLGGAVSVGSWPPTSNHRPVPVRPSWYRLDAKSAAGEADPSRLTIDAREQHDATVQIGPHRAPDESQTDQPAPARIEARGGPSSSTIGGHVFAKAAESVVTVELAGREPPYQTWSRPGSLDEVVPPGPYSVTFRLGHEVFSAHEIYVQAGENVTVEAQVRPSPVMQDLLGLSAAVVPTALFSESIGPIQSGMVETMLPILGVKPFDFGHQVFSAFEPFFPSRTHPAAVGDCALSVVVAVDGQRDRSPWTTPEALLNRTSVHVGVDRRPLPLAVLQSSIGTERVAVGWVAQQPGPFPVTVGSPMLGRLEIPAAALPRRVTVISLRLRPDRSGLSQNILQFPGYEYPMEPGPPSTYGRMLRDLQLGIQLYSTGELASNAVSNDVLQSLLYAKWTDPILGCMAVFSLVPPDQTEMRPYNAEMAAQNLVKYFPDLPDSHVALGLAKPALQAPEYESLLASESTPVLARSMWELAAYADLTGRTGTHAQQLARRIITGSPWAVSTASEGSPLATGW